MVRLVVPGYITDADIVLFQRTATLYRYPKPRWGNIIVINEVLVLQINLDILLPVFACQYA